MPDQLEPLILDLVEWVAQTPRPYDEVMDAWRTSCSRLTVWEDAVDRGYLIREKVSGDGHPLTLVAATPAGQAFLQAHGRGG